MEKNKVSVALCTYNGAKFLREELETIFQQSLVPFEVIICDDNSIDNTVDIIQKYKEEKHVNIRLYKNEIRLGITKNFEKAILLCSGDIILLADQDDLWKKNKVEKIVKYFELHPDKNVVFTNAVIMQSASNVQETIWDEVGFTNSKKEKLKDPLLLLNQLLHHRNLATGATMGIRKASLQKYLPFAFFKNYLHDYLLALQAATDGSLGWIDESLIYYRIHKGQTLGFNRNIPIYFKPLHYLYYGSRKRLSLHQRKKEKKLLAKHLQKFTGANAFKTKELLDKFLKK